MGKMMTKAQIVATLAGKTNLPKSTVAGLLEEQAKLATREAKNAFTVPGGQIYIFTGLLEKLKTDAEVAAVLAHEIGHCAARHTIKKFQAALGYEIVGGAIIGQLTSDQQRQRIAAMGADVLRSLVFSAYGRQDEYEADRLGLRYMDWAGYDLQGMVKTLALLDRESQGSQVPLILRSHPYLKDRIQAVEEEIIRTRKTR
jgi:predicted Zn-dependent protease